ncbi:MAG: ATP-binding cassette domain-containing protein [Clostridia bacterium]|nr:ATP-binding cassette domain-containing protein [Clostridia bacterium]
MDTKKKYAQAILEIMEQLLETDSIDDAISGGLTIMAKLFTSEAAAVWLIDEKENRLVPASTVGLADLSGVSIDRDFGLAGKVISGGKPILIEDASSCPDFDGVIFDDQGIAVKTVICAPIKDSEKTYGCMMFINKRSGVYDRDDLRLCERMAALTAMTIADKGMPDVGAEEREVLISLKNVIKEFRNPGNVTRVLKGVDLNVYKGELLVVLGESGCGKSTMMNIIGGMDYLTDGKLLVEGKDYSHPTDDELTRYRRSYIGFIFQSYNLMPNLSALDNIRFIAEISDDPIAPEEALSLVGLSGKGDSFPSQMSGGQQQRVAIARALVKNPKLILADEPTAALDYETSIEVLSAIERTVKESQTTVIMITHNPEIGKMADRVVKLRSGRVFSIKKNLHPLHANELEW